MAEEDKGSQNVPPSEPQGTVEPQGNNAFDIDSLMNEIVEEEKKAREEQDKKIKEIENKSLSRDELKDALKGILKKQSSSIEEIKTGYETKIDELQSQLNNISKGSKAPVTVDGEPFKAPSEPNPQAEMDKLKEENYDLWCLKHFGVIR